MQIGRNRTELRRLEQVAWAAAKEMHWPGRRRGAGGIEPNCDALDKLSELRVQ